MEKGSYEHKRKYREVTAKRSVTSRSSLSQLLLNSTRKSTPWLEPDLVAAILMVTGLRVGEVLRIRHCDILDNEHVYILPFKRGNAKTIIVPQFLVKQMTAVNPHLGNIFTITYKKVYDHCLRNFDQDMFYRGVKNTSVTHSFRRSVIRNFLLEFRNPLTYIVRQFGWKVKTSIAYYL